MSALASEQRLSPRQAADRAGISTKTIYRWIISGRLPAGRTHPGRGGRYRLRWSDVVAVLEGS